MRNVEAVDFVGAGLDREFNRVPKTGRGVTATPALTKSTSTASEKTATIRRTG